MARQSANVTSLDALRDFKVALRQFEEDVQDAIVTLELEGRRPVDWIEHDRSQYWPREVRKASDATSEARIVLERCELTISQEDRRSCYDERKALEKAKRRLRTAEEKVVAVRRWRMQIRKEVEEFEVQLAKLKQYLETDLVRGIAVLERMSAALSQYAQQGGPPTAATSSGEAGGATTSLNEADSPAGTGDAP